VGHKHNLAFSSLSGTELPKNFTKTTVGFGLIMLCDCIQPTTEQETKDKRQVSNYLDGVTLFFQLSFGFLFHLTMNF